MSRHAFVTWVVTNEPWELEKDLLLSGLRLSLIAVGNASLTLRPTQSTTTTSNLGHY